MKYLLSIWTLILLALSCANGQMTTPASPNTGSPGTPLLPSHAATAAAAPTAGVQVTGKPVVRVNGAVLTDRDLVREMFALFPYAKLHNGFPKAQEPEIRRGALQMIIFEELVYQEAARRKMTVAPERVSREERKFEQQFGSQAEFTQYLETEMSGSKAKLRQQIKRSLLIEAMLKAEVEAKSAVTVSEARLYYYKNPKAFEHGEVFAIQTISILPPSNANQETLKEARKRAEDALRQAKETKSYEEFGLLAEKLSDDDFHVNMGDHKAVDRDKLPPEVVKAALAMQPGQVSELLQLGNAYTFFRLNAHTSPGKTTFEEVEKNLAGNLQKEKYEKLRVALGKRLRQNAKIETL
jgi:parvulin-like peptidyl-prolyl isomerase